MSARFSRQHAAHLRVAQEARRGQDRAADHAYAATEKDRWRTADNFSFNVPIAKYRNVKTDGFDSKREAKRYGELKLLERAGRITALKTQPRFIVVPKQKTEHAAYYVADFRYIQDGQIVVEDVKGFKTAFYILKRKLMLFVHGIAVREV